MATIAAVLRAVLRARPRGEKTCVAPYSGSREIGENDRDDDATGSAGILYMLLLYILLNIRAERYFFIYLFTVFFFSVCGSRPPRIVRFCPTAVFA